MGTMIRVVIWAMAMAAASPLLAKEDWSAFYACLNRHKAAVERAEPSLHDGARLVVDVLCLKEASELGNAMMRAPERQPDREGRNIADSFNSFLHVIRRETTHFLFE